VGAVRAAAAAGAKKLVKNRGDAPQVLLAEERAARRMEVRVLLFAHPRELHGAPFVSLSLPAAASLRDARAALHVFFAPAVVAACALSVGDALVPLDAEATTPCAAEIALIPPVSGG
jgi:hypothetical protein